MKHYTLIIIDMQNEFKASRKKSTIEACKNEIKIAMKNNAGIIFVEYYYTGRTLKALRDLTKFYEKLVIITKENDGGGNEVAAAINHFRFSKTLKVCGVNTDMCVYSTVEELIYKDDFNIQVVSNACNSELDHKKGLSKLKKLGQVEVI